MPKRIVTPPANRKEHAASGSSPVVSGKCDEGSPRPSFPNVSLRRTRFSSVPLIKLKNNADTKEISIPTSVELPRRHVTLCSDTDSDSSLPRTGGFCSDTMDSFRELSSSPPSVRIKHLTRNNDNGASRFPKLDECAHFHYDNVELGPIVVALCEGGDDRTVDGKNSISNPSSGSEIGVRVTSNGKSWQIRRSLDNFQMLDRQLHRCVYDRKFSQLKDISQPPEQEDALQIMLTQYLERFSQLAGSLINCGTVLNWLELDNRGNRLIVTDEAAINTPAVAAAYVVKRYSSQASDEISLEVGDIVSVIDMPPPTESSWWRGKKGFQVGFFPCECVEIIGDKVPQSFKFPKTSTKPVLRKHGKLIAFFRSFLLSRPSRRKLKQSGILKERVFGCDLGEHLMNSGRDIPLVLKCCTEFIEQYGIVDGIYRLSGVTSNIQKLRVAFDEDRIPNLLDEAILQDIHCVASLLKMYFRELPNPLLTFHLYDKFVSAVQADEDIRLLKLRDVVQQLPPPHYRSLEYLMRHLSKVAAHGFQTGMTPKNVAIVWAPNLLRSRDLESGGVGALHVVGVQAVLTEYLIRYTDIIFSEKMPVFPSPKLNEETPKKSRPKSLAVSTPTKLLSLEEARSRALTTTLPGDRQKFIDVGGGEENLPIKYHTVIELPARRYSVGKSKKSPSGWKSFFSRGWQTTSGRRKNRRTRNERPMIGSPIFLQNSPIALQDKAVTEYDVCHTNHKKLRTVNSVETLFPLIDDAPQPDASTFTPIEELPSPSVSFMNESSTEVISSSYSPAKLSSKHVRSNSHDSYFERSLDYSVDEDSEFCEILTCAEQTSVSQIAHENRVKEDAFTDDSKDSPSKRSAQKQKCLNFDSEASSPKLQKLSLKRVYHNVNSPPLEKKAVIKREKNSETIKDTSTYAGKSRSTNSIPINCNSSNHGLNSVSSEVNHQVDDRAGDVQCISAIDDSDNLMDFSMEATLSESVNISQLMSFDSLDQLMSTNNAESTGKELNSNIFPHDSSLATPESPTGDNVSDIPSSGDSDIIESNPELINSKTDSDFILEVESRQINRTKTNSESLKTSAEKQVPCSLVNEINSSSGQVIEPKTSESKSNNSSPNVHKILSLDGSFVGDIILSPPENFVDKSPVENLHMEKSLRSGNISNPKNSNVSCGRSMGRSKTEIHEICSKFVSGIAVSGSFGPELFKTTSDFVDAQIFHKKRSCSDKLSPISPIEDSRRRFESEIGRLIVRDRQMKLEMEQRKSEKQRQNLNTSTATPEKNKMKNKTEKKFADVLDFRKSPLKTDESDMRNKLETDEIFKNFKENIDDRKLSDISPGYSRYVRMENKPSVKELLSKFEGTKRTDESLTKSFIDSPTTSPIKSSVFSNIQVINHSFSLTPTKNTTSNLFDSDQSSKDNHESFLKEHIFQTECVIRFPHPKSSVLSEIQPDSCKNIVKTPIRDPGVSHINGSFPEKVSTNDTRTIKSADNINSILNTSLASDSMQLDKTCTEKERYLDNEMSKCVSSEIQPTVFSGFTDTFQRATRATARMRDEFLRKGLPILTSDNGNGTSLLAQDSYRSPESNHYSLSPPSSRKRQTFTRQRPKSVPPPISRLSLLHTNLTPSPQQQIQNMAKGVSLSSTKELVVDASQMPNRVRDRAALFERSLSFSGHDDKRTISCCHSQKSVL